MFRVNKTNSIKINQQVLISSSYSTKKYKGKILIKMSHNNIYKIFINKF